MAVSRPPLRFSTRLERTFTDAVFLLSFPEHNSWIKSGTSWIDKQRRALDEVVHPLRHERDEAVLRGDRSEQSLELVKEELERRTGELGERTERVRFLEGDVDRKGEFDLDDLFAGMREGGKARTDATAIFRD